MDADYLRNRYAWDATSDDYQRRHGAQLAANAEGDFASRDVLEYGCGAAQWSIALARRGARCTGLDNSQLQLEHARAAIVAAGVDVALVHAAAGAPPFPDASFDLVFCDHGALSFAAPEATIPQIARMLRPGGVLALSVVHPLREVCYDFERDCVSHTLRQSYFELGAIRDPQDGGVSHVRPLATYLALMRPSEAATSSYDSARHDWARSFPAEVMFRARLA